MSGAIRKIKEWQAIMVHLRRLPATSKGELPIIPVDALPPAVRAAMDKPFTGDYDEMVKRRMIRAAVTFNRTHYFIDEGQRGLTYESLKLFEDELNAQLKTGNLKVNVVFVPMSRDHLYTALVDGKVDMVAAMVTVTPEREKLVAFTEPTRTNVSEVVVTGPGAPPVATLGRPTARALASAALLAVSTAGSRAMRRTLLSETPVCSTIARCVNPA